MQEDDHKFWDLLNPAQLGSQPTAPQLSDATGTENGGHADYVEVNIVAIYW